MIQHFLILLCVFISTSSATVSQKKYARQCRSIAEKIQRIIDRNADLHIGCKIYSLKNQRLVYAINEQHLFTPARIQNFFWRCWRLKD